ncbi:MAG: tetratricopeptide repeat protein [Pseudarcicella sp.]|nr:tetratricopeptide repeat protein [Pseudarcicella sp.]MBP6409935.1 tetratricopeptide repeat protein [Pseudarcicella sp.]
MSEQETKSGLEFIETPEGLQQEIDKVSTSIEKNKKLIFTIGGVIIGGVLAFLGYKYYLNSQDEAGEKKLFSSVYKFEADSNNTAAKEMSKIADNYSGKTGNLAHFYAGVAYLKESKYDLAIEELKSFSSNDLVVQARANALIGDAYVEKKAYSDAIDYFKKAVDYKPNKFFTPSYMIKLALAYEANKQTQEAIEVYAQLEKNYPASQEVQTAKKSKSMLEATISE